MFNKLKQFKDLRSQAKTMQSTLAQEIISEEKNGVKLSLNGNMEVVDLVLNPDLNIQDQTRAIKSCFNDALKKTQRLMAKKMQEMGGIPGLS